MDYSSVLLNINVQCIMHYVIKRKILMKCVNINDLVGMF